MARNAKIKVQKKFDLEKVQGQRSPRSNFEKCLYNYLAL